MYSLYKTVSNNSGSLTKKARCRSVNTFLPFPFSLTYLNVVCFLALQQLYLLYSHFQHTTGMDREKRKHRETRGTVSVASACPQDLLIFSHQPVLLCCIRPSWCGVDAHQGEVSWRFIAARDECRKAILSILSVLYVKWWEDIKWQPQQQSVWCKLCMCGFHHTCKCKSTHAFKYKTVCMAVLSQCPSFWFKCIFKKRIMKLIGDWLKKTLFKIIIASRFYCRILVAVRFSLLFWSVNKNWKANMQFKGFVGKIHIGTRFQF